MMKQQIQEVYSGDAKSHDSCEKKSLCYCALNEPSQDQDRTAPNSHTNNRCLKQDEMLQQMKQTVEGWLAIRFLKYIVGGRPLLLLLDGKNSYYKLEPSM